MSKLSGGNANIARNNDLIKKFVREYLPQTNGKKTFAASYSSVTRSIPSICENYSSSDCDSDDSDGSKFGPNSERANNGSETVDENGQLVSDTESNGYEHILPALKDVFRCNIEVVKSDSIRTLYANGQVSEKKAVPNKTQKLKEVVPAAVPSTKREPAKLSNASLFKWATAIATPTENGVQKPIVRSTKPTTPLYSADDVKLGWNKDRKWFVGSGMVNRGNNCYLNSVLQALYHIPSFVNWLVDDQESRKCCLNKSYAECIICTVNNTFKSTQLSTTSSSINVVSVFNKLRDSNSDLKLSFSKQEDAHELFKYLISAMEKAFIERVYRGHDLGVSISRTTPFGQIFGCDLITKVQCKSCNFVSETNQYFNEILLDVNFGDSSSDTISIEDALDHYFEKESINEPVYDCENCKRKVAFSKQFSISRAPKVLCLQIKRFSLSFNKISQNVSYQLHTDLTKYMATTDKAENRYRYRLVSYINHFGEMTNSGHYTAMAQAARGSYHHFNDESVKQCNISEFLGMGKVAYILFYELQQRCPKPVAHLMSKSPSVANENGNKNCNGNGNGVATTTSNKYSHHVSVYSRETADQWKYSHRSHNNSAHYNYKYTLKRPFSETESFNNMWQKRRKNNQRKYNYN